MKRICMFLIFLSTALITSGYAKHKHTGDTSDSSSTSLPAKISATGSPVFMFNPRSHSWAAYGADGTRRARGTANGGSDYCPDIHRRCHTPTGTFRVLSKGDAGCKSTRYPIKRMGGYVVRGGAPMPYCMFFSNNFAIHGYSHLTNANVSHGCIRISTPAAQYLRGFLSVGSKVVIMSY